MPFTRSRPPVLALALAASVLLPFLGKAYTIDDPVFLQEAQHLLSDPLHPSAFEIVWTSDHRLRASAFLPGGPAVAYLLLPLALFDWKEWAGHLLMLVYFAVTILGTVVLASRLGLSLWAQDASGLLVASAPVALGMAGTLMPDIPALMFSVWGIERYVVWMRSKRLSVALATACLLALAVLTRVNLLVLLVVVGVWALRLSWRGIVPAVTAGAFAFIGFLITQDPDPSGGTPLTAAAWQLRLDRSGFHLLALVVAYLLTTPLLVVLLTGRLRGDSRALLSGWLIVPLTTIVYISVGAKYLLPALPAVAILASLGLERVRCRGAALGVVVAVGTVLGVLILRADARMAGEARAAAEELIRPRVEAGERVWYAGHLGFHWYAEAAGAHPVAIEPPYPDSGEVLVAQTFDEPGMLCFLPRAPMAEHGDTTPAGRVMSRRVSAGFYSDIWGIWPWGWAPPDTVPFIVARVTGRPRNHIDPALRPGWCGPVLREPSEERRWLLSMPWRQND